MKTQVQYIYDILKSGYAPEKVVSWLLIDEELMLEKEKEQIMEAYDAGYSHCLYGIHLDDEYYNETFNTNDK
jgi:hypothetical protein